VRAGICLRAVGGRPNKFKDENFLKTKQERVIHILWITSRLFTGQHAWFLQHAAPFSFLSNPFLFFSFLSFPFLCVKTDAEPTAQEYIYFRFVRISV
jgi:hypothetical protein